MKVLAEEHLVSRVQLKVPLHQTATIFWQIFSRNSTAYHLEVKQLLTDLIFALVLNQNKVHLTQKRNVFCVHFFFIFSAWAGKKAQIGFAKKMSLTKWTKSLYRRKSRTGFIRKSK